MSTALPTQWFQLLSPATRAQLASATAAAEREVAAGKHIFPARANWFTAFDNVPPDRVRAVILGQDPYPTRGNAMGLAFSVPRGVKPPASLKNIYKALQTDLNLPPALHGDLSAWATQGVLLLNTILTVEESRPNAHAEFGWREVTDAVIAALGGTSHTPKAFLLWGAQAQKKAQMIDAQRHLILTAPHPSPLSARRGFFDCRHFSQTNAFLSNLGVAPVDWALGP